MNNRLFISSLFSRSKSGSRRRQQRNSALNTNRQVQMHVEPLEVRSLLAAFGTSSIVESRFTSVNSVALDATGAWTATSDSTWLQTSSAGTGDGLVTYTVQPNDGLTRVGTITAAGQTLTVTQTGAGYLPAGTLTSVVSGLRNPGGVAVGPNGDLYFADTDNSSIKRWSASTGSVSTIISNGITRPSAIAVDQSGVIFFIDNPVGSASQIRKWTPSTGAITTGAPRGPFEVHTALAINAAGDVYFGNDEGSVKKWTAATGVTTTIITGLQGARGLAVDVAGNVYATESLGNRVKKWTESTAQVSTLISTGLSSPTGIAVDGSGNVYVASGSVIKRLSVQTGQVTDVIGSGLSTPRGIAVDASGHLHIADSGNGSIKTLPRAFVFGNFAISGSGAASITLPSVLPANTPLVGALAPTSQQSWARITGVSNGAISVQLDENQASAERFAEIQILGRSVYIQQLAPTTISNLGDNGPGSLRNAIALANSAASGAWSQVIVLPSSLYTTPEEGNVDPNVIRLLSELPAIAPNLTLTIRSAAPTADGRGFSISADGLGRIIQTNPGGTLILENMTLMKGVVGTSQDGGAIINSGSLTLINSAITQSSARSGGAIANSGTLRLIRSDLRLNNATLAGGAVFNLNGTVIVEDSALAQNDVSGSDTTATSNPTGGGAVFSVGGEVIFNRAKIQFNTARYGLGAASFGRGFLESGGAGIAIHRGGRLTLTDATVADNVAELWGGGFMVVDSTASILRTTITRNRADSGAGMANLGSDVSVQQCIVSNNQLVSTSVKLRSPVGGGAGLASLFVPGGRFDISDSSITGNTSATVNPWYGQAAVLIDRPGSIKPTIITNSTIANNSFGLATFNAYGTVIHSTVYGNTGGDLHAGENLFTLTNCIVGYATPRGYISPIISFVGRNFVGFGASGPNVISGDPMLGTLQENGGPTLTMAPLPGSPVLDAGDSSAVPADLVADQRGLTRVRSRAVDLGAFETQADGPTRIDLSVSSIGENRPSGTDIGTFSSVDPDTGETFSYALVAGSDSADNGSFEVSPDGQLKTAASFNFETKNSYSIRVRVTDSTGMWLERVFVISINDRPEVFGLEVNPGQTQRSHVRSVKVKLDTTTAATVFTDGIVPLAVRVIKRDLQGQNPVEVPLAATQLSVSNEFLTIDFGAAGLGGNAATNAADGLYAIEFDLERRGTFEVSRQFYRLAGDTNGDQKVDRVDVLAIADHLNAVPASPYDVDLDVDGNGRIDVVDRDIAVRQASQSRQTVATFSPDDTPTDITITNATVSENISAGTVVGEFGVTQRDTASPWKYTLVPGAGSDNNSLFAIDSSGRLTTKRVFNYEDRAEYTVRVRAQNPSGPWHEKVFRIAIVNAPELQGFRINEGLAHRSYLRALELEFESSEMAEKMESAIQQGRTVIGFDSKTLIGSGTAYSDFILQYPGSFTLSVSGSTLRLLELKPFVFSFISALTHKIKLDLNFDSVFDTFVTTYHMTGDTNGDRRLDEADLKRIRDYLATSPLPSFDPNLDVHGDGAITSYDLSIAVSNANRIEQIPDDSSIEPPTDITLTLTGVSESTPANTTIGVFSTTDLDPVNTATYSLLPGHGDHSNHLFSIDANGNLKTATSFDISSDGEYSIRVRSTDGGGMFVEKSFMIKVGNVTTTAPDVLLSNRTIANGRPAGSIVGQLSSTHVGNGRYSLVDGAGDTDNGLFFIDADGNLRTAFAMTGAVNSSYTIRVRRESSDASLSETTFEIRVIRAVPVVAGPGSSTTSMRPTIVWVAGLDAVAADVYVQNLDTNVVVRQTITGTSWTSASDLGIGRFRVWVRSVNAAGVKSAWSQPTTFTVNTAVTVPAQTLGQTVRPTMTWLPLAGAMSYEIWLTDSSRKVNPFIRKSGLTSTSWTPSSDLALGTYTFWVRGVDASGRVAAWSTPLPFTVQAAPTPTSLFASTFSRQPTLTWSAPSGAASFVLTLANQTTGATQTISGITGTSWTPTSNLADGRWTWRIRAVSQFGSMTYWSELAQLQIGGQTTVSTPTATRTSPATFNWLAVSGAASYSLWVNRVDVPQAVIRRDNITTNTFTTSTPLAAGTYRVWVRAVSTSGEVSLWSRTVDFTVANSDINSSLISDEPLLVRLDLSALHTSSEQAVDDSSASNDGHFSDEDRSSAIVRDEVHVEAPPSATPDLIEQPTALPTESLFGFPIASISNEWDVFGQLDESELQQLLHSL